MNGHNLRFRSNPKSYLGQYALVCYTGEGAQKSDINRIDGNTLMVQQEFAPSVDFDLVSNKLGYVDVKIMGGTGTYGGTGRYGAPIVGNYIPYLGQKDRASDATAANFGRINLSRVTTDYVFTFTFTGCNFVVTREGGDVYVYHEPTAATWTTSVAQRYPGATILADKIGPAYDGTHNGGYGCLVRDKITAGRWWAYIQTPTGTKMKPEWLQSVAIDGV
ncbi:MAG: hypothetical protein J0H91_16055 [Rhodospirillales bacterium]|nr:hypothetical protein [Rhodospirillales bacterium]